MNTAAFRFITSNRADGNMSHRFGDAKLVNHNLTSFLTKHIGTPAHTIIMRCDHGDVVRRVNHTDVVPPGPTYVTAEVLVTNDPTIALGLLTADCIPAAFYDPRQRVIALAHLNRRTIAFDLAQKTVGFLRRQFGTIPGDIQVVFGPHIYASSYHFSLPLDSPLLPQLTNYAYERAGNIHIDMTAAHAAQLAAVGVPREQISIAPDNTADGSYFSHYQSTRDPKLPAGRHLSLLSLLSH